MATDISVETSNARITPGTPDETPDRRAVDVARELNVDPSAPVRWHRFGRELSTGERVYLEGVRTPGGYRFSRSAVRRFLARLTEDSRRGPATRPSIDRAEHEACDAALLANGF